MKLFNQYKNLSREIYVLFFGRIVTSMGALIWPLLTLIMKNKLGYSATTIALIDIVMLIMQFPMILIGGKLADHANRKMIIVICDMITVTAYIICGIIPISNYSILILYVASVFATIEGPSYDALIADLSDSEGREQAYSLQYLGMNLGLILAPTIGGLLFENYLNLAFLIDGISTFASTVLIILFIKKQRIEKKQVSEYEEERHGEKIWGIIKERPTFLLYFLMSGFGCLVYAQFNYLLPLNMEGLYGAKGATLFGMLTSTNGIVVIIATPIITMFLAKLMDIRKILVGEILIVTGLFCYKYAQDSMPLCFILMIIFTVGEVFNTIGGQPYMTRRVPSTHWGRMNSVINVVCGAFQGLGNLLFGKVIDDLGFEFAWNLVGIFGVITIGLVFILVIKDKKQFPLLYS